MQVFSRENFLCSALKRLSHCANRNHRPTHGRLGLPMTHNIVRTVLAHAVIIEGGRSTNGGAVSSQHTLAVLDGFHL